VKAAKETSLHADQPSTGGRDQCPPVGQRKEAPLHRTRLDGFAGNEEGFELFKRTHETRFALDFLRDFCGYAHRLSLSATHHSKTVLARKQIIIRLKRYVNLSQRPE
jgi:hypothetical protein